MRRQATRTITGVVALVCLALLAGFAVISRGYPIRKLDLNDTGIWVTNNAGQQLGRVNKSASGLDAWLDVPGGGSKRSFDVLQDGNAIAQYDQTQRALIPVDSASVVNLNDASLQLPAGALVDMRGGTLAVLDPATGKLFATRYDMRDSAIAVHGLDLEGDPVADLGASPTGVERAAALSVGVDGSIHAALVNGKTVTVAAVGQQFGSPEFSQLKQSLKSIQVAAVGGRTVVYDAEQGIVVLPDGTRKELVRDPRGAIQRGGEDSGRVIVALSTGLFRVSFDGTATQIASGMSGIPAAPVRVGDCDFGAWAGGTGTVVRACGDAEAEELAGVRSSGALTQPVFRVNRGQLVLNDTADGRTFDLATQNRLDEWDTIKPKAKADSQNPNQQMKPKPQDAKPMANPDVVGVRPNRSAVGYLLDNDTDALGQILMITEVSGVPSGANVTIAPDGQSVVVRTEPGAAGFSFKYTISNGHNSSESTVRVETREDGNSAPQLRSSYVNPEYSVASFGTLPLSVLGDWRDADGDALTLVSAEVDGQVVPITPEGRIEFVAAREESKVVRTLTYAVTDGISATPTTHKMPITILDAKSLTGTPPVTMPDSVRGEAGRAITFNPLLNDIPGSDPRTPDARLRLGGELRPEAGLDIAADIHSGQVTVTAAAPGSYELSYTAAFGSSTMQAGKIRLDIAAEQAKTPVAMPDQVTIRGTQAVRLDPLANDADPSGGILTIIAVDANPGQLDVAVVSGRWVLITPKTDVLVPNPAVVRYTITNGSQQASGDIVVTQLPAIPDAAPIVKDDLAVVRAGDSVLINTLANDIAPGGEQLTLVTNIVGQPAVGELVVYDPASGKGGLGQAFVHNNQIRYVAPASTDAERQVVIEYYAQLPNGTRSAAGKALVTIKPAPATEADDRAPTPQALEARITAGDRVKISIPTGGQDPDGDSTMVVGLGAAPKLGRVVAQSPTSITYEAYPSADTFGTDNFTVLVADRYGKASPALIRIGVTPPGQPQPPIAIEDAITASPGAVVRVDVLANDLYSRADKLGIVPLEKLNDQLPAGARLIDEVGPVEVQAPQRGGQPVLMQYALRGNGGVGVPAAIKVVEQEGYKNPPVILDEAAVADGQVATADVLARAWDPDGEDAALTAKLLGGPVEATLVGGKVTIPLTGQPQIIPYQVTDASGAVSAAVIFVPSSGTAAPHLVSGGLIELKQNESGTFKLADYVVSPREKKVYFTPKTESASASPVGKLEVEVTGVDTFRVIAKNDYLGPGAVTFEVMDSASATDEGVLSAYVSVPVQVGPPTPVLRCPDTTVTLDAGGRDRTLDITSLCHVWAPDSVNLAELRYDATWQGDALNGVQSEAGGQLTLRAGGAAKPGATGTLLVGVVGVDAVRQPVKVVVRAAPPPTMGSRTFTDIMQGTPVSVPLGIDSPLRDAKPQVVSVQQVSGPASQHTVSGTTLTITPASNVHGQVVYRVIATDVDDKERTDRHVSATFTLDVYGKPDAPGAPGVGQRAQSKAETLSWSAPAANGAPITQYRVVDSFGRSYDCASTTCRITGLTNNVAVSFRVQAYNKAGWGELGPSSPVVTPDEPPPAPTGLRVSNPQDKRLTLSWDAPVFEGSPVKTFYILIDGKQYTTGGASRSFDVPTPSNNAAYEIQLVAENSYDKGPSSKITGQSAGKPLGLNPPTFKPATTAGASTAVTVSWNRPDKNGPNDLTFSVVRDGSKTICSGTAATSCIDDSVVYNGQSHAYVVTATNGAGGADHSASTTASWVAVGVPDRPSAPSASATGTDRQITVTGTAPDSRGARSTLQIFSNGSQVYSGAVNARGQQFAQAVTVQANGAASAITFRVCNENTCGAASASDSVTAYGPIRDLQIVGAGRNGTTVSYTVSVNANGKPVTVYVDGQSVGTTGVGTWSRTVTVDLNAYESSRAFSATASDGTRSAGPVSVTLTSGPKPVPKTVEVHAGTFENVPGPNGCYSARCHHLKVTTSGFSGNVTCQISDSWKFGAYGSSWTQGGNETKEIDLIFGGYWIKVTCDGVTGTNNNWPS